MLFKVYDSIFSRELPHLFATEEEAQQASDELNALNGEPRDGSFWVVLSSEEEPSNIPS